MIAGSPANAQTGSTDSPGLLELMDVDSAPQQVELVIGKARILLQDGRGGVAFLGEDWAAFTPRDDELKLDLGVAQDIVVKRSIDKREEARKNGRVRP